METKHTKGEWKVEGDKRTIKCAQFDIARTYANPPFPENEREAEANAKLIAAAPELLEALNEAKETLKIIAEIHPVAIGDSYTYDMTMKQIEEAIQKATT